MPSSLCHTWKTKFTDPTTSDLHLTSKTTKNDGKLKLSLNTENEAEDTSTMSYGKAIWLQKHRGNRPCVLKMAQKTSFKTIDTDMTYNHPTDMSKFVIPKVTLTCPSEEWPNRAREVEEKAESRWAAFWDPPLTPSSPFQRLVYKLTTRLRKDFTAPLSWSPPQELPNLPFTRLFDLPKVLPSSTDIIDLEQQLRTTVQLLKRVEESLCGAPRLHRCLEEKGYRYLLNTGLWYDPVSKLWYDPTFTFNNPLKTTMDDFLLSTNPQTFTWSDQ